MKENIDNLVSIMDDTFSAQIIGKYNNSSEASLCRTTKIVKIKIKSNRSYVSLIHAQTCV